MSYKKFVPCTTCGYEKSVYDVYPEDGEEYWYCPHCKNGFFRAVEKKEQKQRAGFKLRVK